MTKQEKLDEALKNWDFYELARLTYERDKNMKIEVNDLTPNVDNIKLTLTKNLHFYRTTPF